MASMVGDRLNPAVAAQLKGKRVLVTNDDGIDADGLARLEALARRYCDDVWVIAPATHQSARSRGITLRTPLRVVELGEQARGRHRDAAGYLHGRHAALLR